MPTLYTSSFDANSALREPPTRGTDTVVVGFREQTAAVTVGLDALIDRAGLEGTSIIIEGAHVVPGFFDLESRKDSILAVPVVVTVDDDDMHRSHFAARSIDAGARPAARYSAGFDNIRRVQRYVKSQALSHGVPVIRNYNLDQALAAVIDLVVQRATERAELLSASAERPATPVGAAKGR